MSFVRIRLFRVNLEFCGFSGLFLEFPKNCFLNSKVQSWLAQQLSCSVQTHLRSRKSNLTPSHLSRFLPQFGKSQILPSISENPNFCLVRKPFPRLTILLFWPNLSEVPKIFAPSLTIIKQTHNISLAKYPNYPTYYIQCFHLPPLQLI